jgi:hypothetical protein
VAAGARRANAGGAAAAAGADLAVGASSAVLTCARARFVLELVVAGGACGLRCTAVAPVAQGADGTLTVFKRACRLGLELSTGPRRGAHLVIGTGRVAGAVRATRVRPAGGSPGASPALDAAVLARLRLVLALSAVLALAVCLEVEVCGGRGGAVDAQ